MPARSQSVWTEVALHPLTGGLDSRSRPAEIAPGAFRKKVNMEISPDGKLGRRAGFNRAFFSSGNANWDLHSQGGTRRAITFLHENTANNGSRRLFAGTQGSLFVLDETAGTWTTIGSGFGAYGTRWTAAALQDVVLFTNGYDQIQSYAIGAGATTTVAGLVALQIRGARVVVEFNGFLLLMNFVQAGNDYPTRIAWCDLNDPSKWTPYADPGNTDTLANFQDLPYGDEILAAAPLLGSLYIYTRRAIWRCSLNVTASEVFSFTRVYWEPKNQTGCLTYPQTLVSTGMAHYYMSRDAIYKFSPYSPTPEKEDWLYRAAGAIYKDTDTIIRPDTCHQPVGEFVPSRGELWFSWPYGTNQEDNNQTFVAQLDQKTADLVDHGFSAFCNYRKTPTETLCNESQMFLGVSNSDYCIKEIGGVFYRLLANVGDDLTTDLPAALDNNDYTAVGYNSILRGMIPTGLEDRPKRIRKLRIEDDTAQENEPCRLTVSIGNSEYIADANDDPDFTCSILWEELPFQYLQCSETKTPTQLKAQGLRPAVGKDFRCYVTGRFLYYQIVISGHEPNTLGVGGDSCFERISFDLMPMPKP